MRELEYPFDGAYIMKKKKALKRLVLQEIGQSGAGLVKKRIAVLGGSTTADIVSVLELFLLNFGIEGEFYQSQYGQFRQDALFSNEELDNFKPELIYIHTNLRNLTFKPSPKLSAQEIDTGLDAEVDGWSRIWDSLTEKFACPIIQNNFELPYYRLLGNSDASDMRGLCNFVSRLNMRIFEEIQKRGSLYLNDINWLSANYGLEKWHCAKYWYMYKYCLDINAIPELAYQLAVIIKAIFGKNKKALALDLDNTLWGGIVGDDGVEGLIIGQESAQSMAFYQWQEYVGSLKDIGVVLTVCSKNEEENALAGLAHPEGHLRAEDFAVIKANWEPKSVNLEETARELNILPEAIVLADDNPAERDIVRSIGISAPELAEVEDFIRVFDRSGFFETVKLTEDDLRRNEMYSQNVRRTRAASKYESYEDHLIGLEMKAEIKPFSQVYMQRLAQLANKSNQFNLTTRRYTAQELEAIAASDEYITLYGKLSDIYGDNGVVSEIIGRIDGDTLHIELWLMSCRVLKRDMERAMLDTLIFECSRRGINTIYGYYYPTAKNKMVSTLYESFGFEKIGGSDTGTVWKLYTAWYIDNAEKCKCIAVER